VLAAGDIIEVEKADAERLVAGNALCLFRKRVLGFVFTARA